MLRAKKAKKVVWKKVKSERKGGVECGTWILRFRSGFFSLFILLIIVAVRAILLFLIQG